MARAETKLDWPHLMDEALNAPGNLGSIYSRFHDYSFGNMMLFLAQGIHEPVASASTWKQLGRRVVNWHNRKEVIVPRLVHVPVQKSEEETEEESPDEKRERVARLIGFKVVRAVFALSDTDGPELPPPQLPEWDKETALNKLHIRQVPFASPNGNLQGYARNRDIAINPVAVHPVKTFFHELGHVLLGHTVATSLSEYGQHRGIMEFQAEAVAYLAMNELEQLDEETATHSRGYIRHWLGHERPGDREIRLVFSATEQILKAGRLAATGATEGVEG